MASALEQAHQIGILSKDEADVLILLARGESIASIAHAYAKDGKAVGHEVAQLRRRLQQSVIRGKLDANEALIDFLWPKEER